MKLNGVEIYKTIEASKEALKKEKGISPSFLVMIELLLTLLKLLADKLATNSSNSNLPPSKNPLGNKPKKKTRKSKGKKKKIGGQKGHVGTTLKQVENPDEIIKIKIDRRTIPEGNYKDIGCEVRQVIDIKITSHVVEYQAQILEDDNGTQFVATFPNDVGRPVQYGAKMKANSVYMSQFQLIPYSRIQDHFADQMGIPISTGTIVNNNRVAYELLEEFEEICKAQLINGIRINSDETGINIASKTQWLHVASNDQWTLYYPHAKRGEVAMNEMGILPNFKGTLCHDHWKSYYTYSSCDHSLCNAHHLRELERAFEQDDQQWAKKMSKLLLKIKEAVEGNNGVLSDVNAKIFSKKYDRILKDGSIECPAPAPPKIKKRGKQKRSKSRNLLERLTDYKDDVLRFTTREDIPFTNNLGEADIRMTKVQQKISGCFRSTEGAKIFCRNRSYISTCRKNGISPSEALENLFKGKLPDFIEKLRKSAE